MKNKSKLLGLATSMIALVMCVVMLIGTTLAWFTAEVTNDGNRVESGTMKVNLLKYDAVEQKYQNIGENKLFDGLWEPGMTKIAFLAVENAGSLAFNYNIVLNITEGDKPLSTALDYAIISPMDKAAFDAANLGSWDAIVAHDDVETGDVPLGKTVAAPNGALENEETDYFILAIHMDKESANVYQGGWIDIDLEIVAKQMAVEDDYFGDQYDAGTTFPTEPGAPVEWVIHHPHGLLDFEDGKLDPMTEMAATATVVDDNGDKVLKLSANGRAQYSNVDSTKQYGIVTGNTYRLSGYYKVENSATVPSFHIWHVGADTVKLTDYVVSTTTDGWNYFEYTFTATDTRDTLVQFILNAYDATVGFGTNAGVTYFDDVAFEIYVGDQNG